MDVGSFSSLEELIGSLLSRNGLPGLKSLPTLEEAHNPMGMASSTKSLKLELLDNSVLHLFLKIRREGSEEENIDKVFGLFNREKIMYGTILPMLFQFQKENSIRDTEPQLKTMFPKFYGAGLINNDMFLVFENVLQDTGRYVTSKREFHSKDQILLCMRQLATFHSINFTFQLKSNRNLLAEFASLEEPVFHPAKVDHIRSYFQRFFLKHLKIIQAIRKEYSNENQTVLANIDRICSEEKLDGLIRKSGGLMEDIHDLLKPDKNSVVTHGDFHMWNIAFQGKDPALQAIFFDLQVSRLTSGVTDIVQYLYQVTTPEERRISVQEYLAVYSQSFRSTCESLGLSEDQDVFSTSWLSSEFERLAPWGLMYGMVCILPRFVENNHIFSKVDTALEEDNAGEVVNIVNDSGSNMWWAIQLLFDVIIEFQ